MKQRVHMEENGQPVCTGSHVYKGRDEGKEGNSISLLLSLSLSFSLALHVGAIFRTNFFCLIKKHQFTLPSDLTVPHPPSNPMCTVPGKGESIL